MTFDQEYIYLGIGFLGGILSAGLALSSYFGLEQSQKGEMLLSQTITLSAIVFSSAIYCLVAAMILSFVFSKPWPLGTLSASTYLGFGSLLAGLIRGLIVRRRIQEGNMNFFSTLVLIVATEVIVLGPLIYFLYILFV